MRCGRSLPPLLTAATLAGILPLACSEEKLIRRQDAPEPGGTASGSEGTVLMELAAKGEQRRTSAQPIMNLPSLTVERKGGDEWRRQRARAAQSVRPRPRPQKRPRTEEMLLAETKLKSQMQQDKLDKVAQRVGGTIGSCHSQGRWPKPEKFDLIMSWWTDRPQSDIKQSSAASLLQESSSSGFENQAEIKYALRSFEKHGLLDHVGTVFLLVDAAVIDKHGAPRFFNYSNKALRIVTDRDLGVEDKTCPTCGKWRKFLALDKVGVSDYFLWLPDDNFMLKPFQMDYLYEEATGKPQLYSYGSFSLGWCDGLPPVGSAHGPLFVNKCAFDGVALNYWKLMRAHGMGVKRSLDVPCLYTNGMKSFWKWRAHDSRFHRECHTNAPNGCPPWDPQDTPLFLNLQGNGISDEYSSTAAKESWGAKLVMPHGPARWFHDSFPTPSRFEL